MALPADSFTLAMVGIAPANTASTHTHIHKLCDLGQSRVKMKCVCVSVSVYTLTRWCVLFDPLQQVFLWQVAEFSHDAPLLLQVGHALNRHDGHDYKHGSVLLHFLTHPAEQLHTHTHSENSCK